MIPDNINSYEYLVKQTIQKLKNTKISDLVKLKQNLFEVETKLKTAESFSGRTER